MGVKGRAVFATKASLQTRPDPSGGMYQIISSARAAVDNLAQELEDAYFATPILGAARCLVLAKYSDARVKQLVKLYTMSCVPRMVDDPEVPLVGRLQDMLYDMYQWDSLAWAQPEYVHAVDLVKEIFEDIVRDYGGQEELDKIHQALEAQNAAKQEPHGCVCCHITNVESLTPLPSDDEEPESCCGLG